MNYRGKEKGEYLPSFKEVSPSPIPVSNGVSGRNFSALKASGMKAYRLVCWRLILLLGGTWLAVIHYVERIYVINCMKRCNWSNWEQWKPATRPHRLAIVADPQIVDDYSYESTWSVAMYFIKKVTDNYLYRNYRFMQEYIDPDTTLFLGDLFDGGREWNNKAWLEEYRRFNRIFPKKVNRRTIQSVPGNHDIGFQDLNTDVIDRFSEYFGESNDFWEIGNHSFVLLDTISLSSENEKIRNVPLEFLKRVEGRLNPYFPRILLTHVPLYRDADTQECGPHRESTKKFPIQKGKQYQTVIEAPMSDSILQRLTPSIVFSGDDHDYCEINHSYSKEKVETVTKEITVKSAAMSSGIQYPAIQLLSLHNPYDPSPKTTLQETNTLQTNICYMPSSYTPLKLYGLLLSFTFLVLINHSLFRNKWINSVLQGSSRDTLEGLELPSIGSKWKPRSKQSGDNLQNVFEFIIHSLAILCIVYLLFGIYYRYV